MNTSANIVFFITLLISFSGEAQREPTKILMLKGDPNSQVTHVIVDTSITPNASEASDAARDVHLELKEPVLLKVWINGGRLHPFLQISEALFALSFPLLAYAAGQIGFMKSAGAVGIVAATLWIMMPQMGYAITIQNGKASSTYPVTLESFLLKS